MTNLTKIIAQNIKDLRLERDLTISMFAAKTSLSEEIVSEIEEGIHRPTPEELLKISEAFQISPSRLGPVRS